MKSIKTDKDQEALVAQALQTPERKKRLRQSIQLAGAIAADQFPPTSLAYHVARALAGLPPEKVK